MKKNIILFLVLFLLFPLTGCSNSIDYEAIEHSIEEIGGQYDYYYLHSYVDLFFDENYFTYDYENDKLTYNNHNIIDYNLGTSNEEFVPINDYIDNPTETEKEQILDYYHSALDSLKIESDDLKVYLRENLEKDKTRFEKLSNEKKLIELYPDNEDEIKNLSKQEQKTYYEYYLDDLGTSTYSSLAERYYLEKTEHPLEINTMIDTIKNMSDNLNLDVSIDIDDFMYQQAEDTSGVIYNIWIDSYSTSAKIWFLYTNPTDLLGVSVTVEDNDTWNEYESVIWVICAQVAMCFDNTLSLDDATYTVIKSQYDIQIKNNCAYQTEKYTGNNVFKFNIAKTQ